MLFVLGMHRSGTSAIARALIPLGVDFGEELIAPAADNPRGFFEDRAVVALNDRILAATGMRWSSLRDLDPALFETGLFDDCREQGLALVRRLSGSRGVPGLKDPRLCRLMPLWESWLTAAAVPCRYLLIVRDPRAVARSLQKRNGLTEEQASLLWLSHMLPVLRFLSARDHLLLDYDQLLSDPRRWLAGAADRFGLALDEPAQTAAAASLEGDLRHHQGESLAPVDLATSLALRVHRQLQPATGWVPAQASPPEWLEACVLEGSRLESLRRYGDAVLEVSEQFTLRERAWYESRLANSAAELDRGGQAIRELQDEVRRQREEVARLAAEVAARGFEITRLDEKIRGRDAELVAMIQDRDRWAEEAKSSSRERSLLSEALQANAQSLLTTCAERDRLRDETHALQAAMATAADAAQAELSRVWEIQAVTRRDVDDREREIVQLKGYLADVFASTSWRLTAPVRWIGAGAKSLRAGARAALYALARGRFLPPALTHRAIHLVRRLGHRFIQETSNASNRASMERLASERTRVLEQRYGVATPEAEWPPIDLSVVTYNSVRWLDDFTSSLLRQDYPCSLIHLRFVDNGSSDGTMDRLRELQAAHGRRFASLQIHQRPNLGFGAGHDHAIRQGRSAYLLVSNVDLTFARDAIVRVVVDALSGDARFASWEMRQKPYEHPKYYDPVTLETAWSSHACILLRRSAYEQVGGYEKRIFMYGEDVEYSYRIRDAGFLAKYTPGAVVWHHTYAQAEEVKPLQYLGSTLANAYIRLRFGTLTDVLAIPAMYAAILVAGTPIPRGRLGLLRNLGKIVLNLPYFLLTRKRSDIAFPFRGWDFELRRDGAFHVNREPPSPPPLVSIVTRTYAGRERWLREALASVLNQTWPAIELLVVDDGGDSHRELLDRVARLLPAERSLRYLPQPKRGRSACGNAGLAAAKGRYIMFLDDDDLLYPDHLEVLVAELEAAPALGGAYALSWEVLTRRIQGGEPHYSEELHLTPDLFRQEFSREVIRHHNFIPIQALLFRRELYERHGGLDEEMDALEDWNLWVRYSSEADFKYVAKTTSLFRTPHDPDERIQRHMLLHAAYETAVGKQTAFLASLDPTAG